MRTAKFPEGKPASHLLQHHVNRTCFISWTLYFSCSCTHPWPPLTSLLFVEIGQTFTVLSSCMLFSKKAVITIKAHTAKFLSTLPSTNTTAPSLWPTISHRTFLNSLSHIETPKFRQKGQAALKNKMHLWLKDPLQGHYYLSSFPSPRSIPSGLLSLLGAMAVFRCLTVLFSIPPDEQFFYLLRQLMTSHLTFLDQKDSQQHLP